MSLGTVIFDHGSRSAEGDHVAAPLGLDELMLKLLDKRIRQALDARPEAVSS